MGMQILIISFSFGIKHLSAYHLTIEQGTVFGKMNEERAYCMRLTKRRVLLSLIFLLKKQRQPDLFIMKFQISESPDIFQFIIQITGNRLPYLGLGPSAHSFNGYSRQWNVRDLKKYIKSVNSGKAIFEKEELDIKTRFNEYIMTSLRTMWGIDLDYVEKTF